MVSPQPKIFRIENQGAIVLWLCGILGCVLGITVIEDLMNDETYSRGLLYCYFDFNYTGKKSFESTLKSLVY